MASRGALPHGRPPRVWSCARLGPLALRCLIDGPLKGPRLRHLRRRKGPQNRAVRAHVEPEPAPARLRHELERARYLTAPAAGPRGAAEGCSVERHVVPVHVVEQHQEVLPLSALLARHDGAAVCLRVQPLDGRGVAFARVLQLGKERECPLPMPSRRAGRDCCGVALAGRHQPLCADQLIPQRQRVLRAAELLVRTHRRPERAGVGFEAALLPHQAQYLERLVRLPSFDARANGRVVDSHRRTDPACVEQLESLLPPSPVVPQRGGGGAVRDGVGRNASRNHRLEQRQSAIALAAGGARRDGGRVGDDVGAHAARPHFVQHGQRPPPVAGLLAG
mmetsp:Transcript_110045/g.320356  ORF Transcript_110045/g.320356 Transcript_110045/m.320356 type:complete len:335 (-) Transcript_110045:1534-2538(-)